ncbi:MAG: hypothetical protein ACYCPV_03555 [Thermoplasmata archaeon]
MRGHSPISVHRSPARDPTLYGWPGASEGAEPDGGFVNRPCYAFNHRIPPKLDDRRCDHCRHYLTPRCPHIEEFLDEVDDPTSE